MQPVQTYFSACLLINSNIFRKAGSVLVQLHTNNLL